jgi:hypothetical protein
MKANAYARQAEQLINKYKVYHFIVMLPLPPKYKTQEELIRSHRAYVQKCSLIVTVLMQVKLIVILLVGLVEREPHATNMEKSTKPTNRTLQFAIFQSPLKQLGICKTNCYRS